MITIHAFKNGKWEARQVRGETDLALPEGAAWLDLASPGEDEKAFVAKAIGADVPTREEMQEIEASSRLYQENGAVYMTATILSRLEPGHIDAAAITFILAGQRLVTLRYTEPRPFEVFAARLRKGIAGGETSPDLMLGLLEAIVDRLADIVEATGNGANDISHRIFRQGKGPGGLDLHQAITDIGIEGDHVTKLRESLASISRMVMFLGQAAGPHLPAQDFPERLRTLGRDTASLIDHVGFLSSKITFLLDASLGMINIQQNNIIKIFSVAAVVFLPPTLIASIYGMNFAHMPELAHEFGYPLALGLMVVSAVLPYVYFKSKKWL